MALEDFTHYQRGIIRRYYANQDQIHFQKLSEQCTELFLAEGKSRAKLWKSIGQTLTKLGIPQSRIDHLVQQDDAALVARLLTELSKSK